MVFQALVARLARRLFGTSSRHCCPLLAVAAASGFLLGTAGADPFFLRSQNVQLRDAGKIPGHLRQLLVVRRAFRRGKQHAYRGVGHRSKFAGRQLFRDAPVAVLRWSSRGPTDQRRQPHGFAELLRQRPRAGAGIAICVSGIQRSAVLELRLCAPVLGDFPAVDRPGQQLPPRHDARHQERGYGPRRRRDGDVLGRRQFVQLDHRHVLLLGFPGDHQSFRQHRRLEQLPGHAGRHGQLAGEELLGHVVGQQRILLALVQRHLRRAGRNFLQDGRR